MLAACTARRKVLGINMWQVTLLLLLGTGRFACGQSSCPHQYTVQPPQDIACNPYQHRTVQMECAVTGSNLYKIQWYFSPSNIENMYDEDVFEITNNSKYTLESVSSLELLRVTLVVHNLNEENDTGTYYCRAFLLDGTILDSPHGFELKESSVYAEGLPCSPNVALKSGMSVCAIPYIPTTPDVSTTTPSPSPIHSTTVLLPTISVTPAGIATVSTSSAVTLPNVATSNSSPIPILYIIIGLVGFLATMCIVLGFVICLLCKRVRNKGSGQAMEFGCISNQTHLPSKRSDFTIFPRDSSSQSDIKGSTGDYAEIGPALMSSMRFHSSTTANDSHYSEINDIVLQPFSYPTPESSASGEARNTLFQDPDNKENAYDEPKTEPNAETSAPAILCHNYSKLERKIPLIYVTSESDESEGEYYAESSTASTAQSYHSIPEKSGAGNMFTYNDVYASDQEASDTSGSSSGTFPIKHHLPTILEHPYHILEQSGVLLDMDYQPSVLQDQSKSYADNADHSKDEYDRLVDPELYSILDRSISDPGLSDQLSRIYDIQTGPYTKLEPKASSQVRPKSRSVTKLELSAEIFDDAQYVSPVPTRKSADMDLIERHDKKGCSKYHGDYERDPIYMENIRSGPKSTDMYQPLEVNAMDPIQDYEKYLKPQPLSTSIATNVTAVE